MTTQNTPPVSSKRRGRPPGQRVAAIVQRQGNSSRRLEAVDVQSFSLSELRSREAGLLHALLSDRVTLGWHELCLDQVYERLQDLGEAPLPK